MDISSLHSYDKGSLPSASQSGASVSSPSVAVDPQVAASQSSSTLPSAQALQEAAKQLNKVAAANASTVEFSVDSSTDQAVVKVVDKSNGDVIRQIPSQEALDLAQSINQMQGLILRAKV